MLSLLPQLLFLSPFAPSLLRIIAALYFAYAAWFLLQEQERVRGTKLPLIGHPPLWAIWLSAAIIAGTAALLFVGAWTQAVAILAALIALKHGIGSRSYPTIVPFSTGTYVLLFCISVTLIVTGAGALAFDLPL